MRVVFMGTPAFALPTLKALRHSNHEIVGVYTQPPRPAGRGQQDTPSPVQIYAHENMLTVYTPQTLKSPEAQAQFAGLKADIAVVVAYGLLLPQPILDAYPFGCINVHPSLLPRWRGAAPIQRTIMAGDRETGVVIMQMDKGLDTGDMLMVEDYEIPKGMTAGQLHNALSEMAAPMVTAVLREITEKTIRPVKQSDTGVEYAKKITRDECRIDWNRPAESIYYHIIGLNPVPGAYFNYKGEMIKVFNAGFDPKATFAVAGTVVDDKLGIACNPGIIYPSLLQRPNKKRMPLGEFMNGFSIPVKTSLA